ncbi:MAG: hypothetical protein WDN45_01610 [Caulobacteraceae bacterium]
MASLSTDLEKPARKATRASKAAAATVRTTAKAVEREARTFSRRSAKHLKAGAAKGSKQALAVRGAGEDAADIAARRLQAALEGLQASSAEMSRWAGGKALQARDQASEMVRERPVGALGAMLAVGALLGLVASLALRAD